MDLFSISERDVIVISFQLEDESEVQLSSGAGSGSLMTSELLDMNNNVLLTAPEGLEASTVLPPGMYELNVSATAQTTGRAFGSPVTGTNLDLNVTAGFTPVVPEPRWTVLGVLFAGILAGFAMSRRFRAS